MSEEERVRFFSKFLNKLLFFLKASRLRAPEYRREWELNDDEEAAIKTLLRAVDRIKGAI